MSAVMRLEPEICGKDFAILLRIQSYDTTDVDLQP
ncbi:uncharacterized protein UBRO2_05964 [Ustilago bromivora]|uniref:Uncharacterized protein n=1 Tax=Ustilago bromivora TaxID=307758 RepID=A0A8H8QTM3_9BASI|nr:uncharacterized protein UBRO2_05964 [Ustilago bromivora]